MVKYIFIVATCALFISCHDDAENGARQNIIGSWDVVDVVEEYRDDTLIATTDTEFEAHFLENETGYTKSQGGFKSIYDWYFQNEPAKVILAFHSSGPIMLINQTRALTVLNNQADKQVWTYITEGFNEPDVLYYHTWTMVRQ